jgi:hypothetical protein
MVACASGGLSRVRLTNQYGAPEQFLRAVQNDEYSRGDASFSATGLIRPPQMARLEEEHADKISADVADHVYMLLGTGVHAIMEKAAPDGSLVEKRWYAEMLGYKISGAIDLYHDGHITDYKVTGTYSVKSPKVEWEQQLNIYAWLLRQNDMPVRSLTIVAICRDHMKSKVGTKNYPDSPIVPIDIPVWLPNVAEDFVRSRVELHTSQDVVPCTDEERWARGNRYVRCESYCSVSDFCSQHNKGEI